MHWENQNPVTSRMPRVAFTLMAVAGVAGMAQLAFSVRDLGFSALQVVFFTPFLAALNWSGWRSVAVRSVSLDSDAQRLRLEVGGRAITLPLAQVSSVGLSRGLVWIQCRTARGGRLFGRAYVLALYDQALRDFVTACEQAGVRVVREHALLARHSDGVPD